MNDFANLYTAKAFGQHFMHKAREKGEDASKPMAFVGLVTAAIGVFMMINAMKAESRGR